MPPEVIGQILRTTFDLPFSQNLKTLRIDYEDAPGTVSARRTERAHENSAGSAVHGMRFAVSRARCERLRVDHPDDFRLTRIGLRIDDVDSRRTNARNDQVAALRVRVRRVGGQASAARVPAEMMQLIASVRHVEMADELAVLSRCRVHIDDSESIVSVVLLAVEQRNIRKLFNRSADGSSR